MQTSPMTQAVRSDGDCEAQLKVASERLSKALDGYEKATKALGFAQDEIAARVKLDALKDQIIAVKDLIIASQDELIKRLSKKKNGTMARLKQILDIAEKVALIGVGVAVGHGL